MVGFEGWTMPDEGGNPGVKMAEQEVVGVEEHCFDIWVGKDVARWEGR